MEWKTSWSYLPVDLGTVVAKISDISQQTVFWNNLSGTAIRIRFSNRYGTTQIKIARAALE
ncbi:MAG: hypothetical protein ILP10_01955, partial [Lachnospiraceae bacterium]|nr:hypothetical protein [Lachnospiraceae bacterium]